VRSSNVSPVDAKIHVTVRVRFVRRLVGHGKGVWRGRGAVVFFVSATGRNLGSLAHIGWVGDSVVIAVALSISWILAYIATIH
jgi:hypothetical protein